jgi:hypothetical protein
MCLLSSSHQHSSLSSNLHFYYADSIYSILFKNLSINVCHVSGIVRTMLVHILALVCYIIN